MNIREMTNKELVALKSKILEEERYRKVEATIKEHGTSIQNFVAENEFADAANLELEMFGLIFDSIVNGYGDPHELCSIGLKIYQLEYERY